MKKTIKPPEGRVPRVPKNSPIRGQTKADLKLAEDQTRRYQAALLTNDYEGAQNCLMTVGLNTEIIQNNVLEAERAIQAAKSLSPSVPSVKSVVKKPSPPMSPSLDHLRAKNFPKPSTP